MRVGWEWSLLRVGLGICFGCIAVRVIIADFPSGMSWWDILIQDRSGLIHELWYITMWFWFAITSTYLWQLLDRKTKKVVYFVRKDGRV